MIASSDPGFLGRAFSEIYSSAQHGRARLDGSLVSDGRSSWLLASKALPTGETLLLLLDWEHVSSNLNRLWALHGLHFVVTVVVFWLLLWIVTKRFVRTPLAAGPGGEVRLGGDHRLARRPRDE